MGLGRTRWELAVGLLASAGAVALVTAAVEVLKLYVPGLSLGVRYGVAGLAARVLGVPHARIVLGAAEPEADERAYALAAGERSVGTLLVPAEHALEAEAAGRFLPALASLLAVEIDRTALEAEALEAEALRRSDAIKTAVLHSVSHDLRSPLTAIVAAASGLAPP